MTKILASGAEKNQLVEAVLGAFRSHFVRTAAGTLGNFFGALKTSSPWLSSLTRSFPAASVSAANTQ
jgi:hypothetical protein